MRKLLIALILLTSSTAYASTISFDQLAASADLTVAKWNADMNRVYQKVNGAIGSDNITDDSLAEADMADEINPRIRTFEGAACEFVYTGLTTATTVGTLTGSIAAGTAYPQGYRVVKGSATSNTYTGDCTAGSASGCWTFQDIDQNGTFTFQEVAILGTTPSVAANSIRLARVSTDGTQIAAVQDLRTTSCSDGPFSSITNESQGASLGDLLTYGSPMKRTGTAGFIQGLHISRDTTTTFRVYPGCAYINGEYRCNTSNLTVPQTLDAPTDGTSGLDTGAIAASTRYNVFAIADRDAVNTLSVTYSTSNPPAGVTNARKFGEIATDASSSFISADILQTNNVNDRELISGWIAYDATGTGNILDSYNVSSLTDNGTGDFTVTWDKDFLRANYAIGGNATSNCVLFIVSQAVGSVRVTAQDAASNAAEDTTITTVLAVGESS